MSNSGHSEVMPTDVAISSAQEVSAHSAGQAVLRGVLAVFGGVVVGSIVNICLVNVGPYLIPLPDGVDVSSMEKLQASMPLMQPANFLFPYLGHALGTLVGAFVAAKLALARKLVFALVIGLFFQLGGISAVLMLGGPAWFNTLDLLTAYIPMGLLGWWMAKPAN